jgi:uncharacterized protein HemX
MVAEAEYLLKLAQQRLELAQDKDTALAALQQADQRLQDAGDSQWGLVRDQLSRDIATLQAFKAPDIHALLKRLDRLNVLFEKLHPRLMAKDVGSIESAKEATAPASRQSESLEGLAQDLWQGLQGSVKIRRYDQPVESLLTSGQEALILQNLELITETLRLALIRKTPALYQGSLQRLQQWLTRYYVLDDEPGAQVVAEVQALQNINIAPAIPDISLALKALQTRQQLGSSGVAQ